MHWVSKVVKQSLEGMTVEGLAQASGKPVDLLCKLARDTSIMYKPTRRQKKRGGVGYREIDPPRREYKDTLRKLARVLASTIKQHPAAHGGVRGRSSFTSARLHCGAKFIVTRDVSQCYPSVKTGQLRRVFCAIGASPSFAVFLSSIMTVHGRLPQGGPLSSLALNLYLLRTDDHLYQMARASRGNFGRLADDFVMSTDSRKVALAFGNEIDHAIAQQQLTVNERKRRDRGFLAGHQLKDIHSLIANSRRGVRPKQEHIAEALGLANYYARRVMCAQPNDLPCLADLRARCHGWMYYFRQADFSPAKHLRHMLTSADAKIVRMLSRKGLVAYKNKWWLVQRGRTGQNEPQRLAAEWQKRMRSHTPGRGSQGDIGTSNIRTVAGQECRRY